MDAAITGYTNNLWWGCMDAAITGYTNNLWWGCMDAAITGYTNTCGVLNAMFAGYQRCYQAK